MVGRFGSTLIKKMNRPSRAYSTRRGPDPAHRSPSTSKTRPYGATTGLTTGVCIK